MQIIYLIAYLKLNKSKAEVILLKTASCGVIKNHLPDLEKAIISMLNK